MGCLGGSTPESLSSLSNPRSSSTTARLSSRKRRCSAAASSFSFLTRAFSGFFASLARDASSTANTAAAAAFLRCLLWWSCSAAASRCGNSRSGWKVSNRSVLLPLRPPSSILLSTITSSSIRLHIHFRSTDRRQTCGSDLGRRIDAFGGRVRRHRRRTGHGAARAFLRALHGRARRSAKKRGSIHRASPPPLLSSSP